MQRVGEAKLYASSTIHLAAQPFVCINRLPSLDAPKRAHTGKLITSLLLKGLSELQSGEGISSVVIANTAPEDELLIQRFWPAESVIRMYPSSYSVAIDQIFKDTQHKSILSFVSDQSPYLDPRWDEVEAYSQADYDEIIASLSERYRTQKYEAGLYQPVVLEEVTGNARILDERDRAQRHFTKLIQSFARKKGVTSTKPTPGWSCGVLTLKDFGVDKAASSSYLFRHEFDMTHSLEGFLDAVSDCVLAHLANLNITNDQLSDIVISAASFKAACYLTKTIGRKNPTIDLPDFLYGWNPVASLVRLFSDTSRTSVGVFVEKLPFVDIVVMKHGR